MMMMMWIMAMFMFVATCAKGEMQTKDEAAQAVCYKSATVCFWQRAINV